MLWRRLRRRKRRTRRIWKKWKTGCAGKVEIIEFNIVVTKLIIFPDLAYSCVHVRSYEYDAHASPLLAGGV